MILELYLHSPLYAFLMWAEDFTFNVFYMLALHKVCHSPDFSVG